MRVVRVEKKQIASQCIHGADDAYQGYASANTKVEAGCAGSAGSAGVREVRVAREQGQPTGPGPLRSRLGRDDPCARIRSFLLLY